MIDRLGVAGHPLLIDLLELALLLPDVLPEDLALELILDDHPLLGGEHGRIEGWLAGELGSCHWFLLFSIITCLSLRNLAWSWLANRLVRAGLLSSFAKLLALSW